MGGKWFVLFPPAMGSPFDLLKIRTGTPTPQAARPGPAWENVVSSLPDPRVCHLPLPTQTFTSGIKRPWSTISLAPFPGLGLPFARFSKLNFVTLAFLLQLLSETLPCFSCPLARLGAASTLLSPSERSTHLHITPTHLTTTCPQLAAKTTVFQTTSSPEQIIPTPLRYAIAT